MEEAACVPANPPERPTTGRAVTRERIQQPEANYTKLLRQPAFILPSAKPLKTLPHVRGVHADPLIVQGNQEETLLKIRPSPGAEPFNVLIEIFAQTATADGLPSHSGSTRLELTRPTTGSASETNR